MRNAPGDAAQAPTFRRPTLIVDYRLRGGHDGIDAVMRLRGVYGDVPAIVVSGESSSEHLARIARSGLVLLHKPVAPAKLRAALAFAIDRRRRSPYRFMPGM
jgi:DNA-binding response OmpR family regulator